MGIKPETAKDLKDISGMVTSMSQQNQKIQPVFKATTTDLEKAITDANSSMIELLRPKLKKLVADMDTCMATIEGALTLMKSLEQDQDFVDSPLFDKIKELMAKVTTTQKTLTDELEQARDLDKRAAKAGEAAEGSQAEAEQELALLKNTIGALKKEVDKNDPEVSKLEDAARKAYAERNQKGLTEAREKLIAFLKPRQSVAIFRARVEKFLKKFHFHDLNTEAGYLTQDLDSIDDSMKNVQKVVEQLIDLHQVPKLDVAKACKVLSIASKDQGQLAKVLNGQAAAYLKGLDALAKTLKLDTTGKEMLTKLQKADVV